MSRPILQFDDIPADLADLLSSRFPDRNELLRVVNESLETPPEIDPRLEAYLGGVSADGLKRLARQLCGSQIGQPAKAKAKEHLLSFWRDWRNIIDRVRNASGEERLLLGLLSRIPDGTSPST
jgi:hypothetical protein